MYKQNINTHEQIHTTLLNKIKVLFCYDPHKKKIIHYTIVSLLELFIITNNDATFVHAIFNKKKSETIQIIEPLSYQKCSTIVNNSLKPIIGEKKTPLNFSNNIN
jgi:hypothetical protein